METGFSLARKIDSNQSFPFPLIRTLLTMAPLRRGRTTKIRTDDIKVSKGIVISVTPKRKRTMGMKAKRRIKSLIATWTNVYSGSPFVR